MLQKIYTDAFGRLTARALKDGWVWTAADTKRGREFLVVYSEAWGKYRLSVKTKDAVDYWWFDRLVDAYAAVENVTRGTKPYRGLKE